MFDCLGTFIFNNEKEKAKYDGVKRTVSLWSYFNRPEILLTFLNPFYEPNVHVLWPSVAAQSIVSRLLCLFDIRIKMKCDYRFSGVVYIFVFMRIKHLNVKLGMNI
jgi:hypothetical protein